MFVDRLYVKSEVNDRFIKVVAICATEEHANRFIEKNPDFGVIKNIAIGPIIFIANNKDLGVEA